MASDGRRFGKLRKLPSGRWQASYLVPDGRRFAAPQTFDAKIDADSWLLDRRRELQLGTWTDPAASPDPAPIVRVVTVGEYAEAWVRDRRLKPRTQEDYGRLLRRLILPVLGDLPITGLTRAAVRAWYDGLDPDAPTLRAHAYGLLRTICKTAVAEELIAVNPVNIHSAGQVKRVKEPRPATVAELDALIAALPERYRAMAALAAWCGLRFGELIELRRWDVDLRAGTVSVRRGATRTRGAVHVGDPKSEAGKRAVHVPAEAMPALRHHMGEHVPATRDALVFPAAGGGHMAPSALYRVYYPARDAAGRPDLRFHDLRHTGATRAAQAGATIAELQNRLGHSTAGAAMRYQHASAERDKALAERMSQLAAAERAEQPATAPVVPLVEARKRARADRRTAS
jgi:integrase